MAVVLRCSRKGNTHRPYYHVVAADSRMKRDGRYIEKIGGYNPLNDSELTLDAALVEKWINNGAKPSLRVKSLLRRAGLSWTPKKGAPAQA